MPVGAHASTASVKSTQQKGYIRITIPNINILVALLSLYPALYPDNLRLIVEFHAEQVFNINLLEFLSCFGYLVPGGIIIVYRIVGVWGTRAHLLAAVVVDDTLPALVEALEEQLLLGLVGIHLIVVVIVVAGNIGSGGADKELNPEEVLLSRHLLNNLLTIILKSTIANISFLNIMMNLCIEFPNGERHVAVFALCLAVACRLRTWVVRVVSVPPIAVFVVFVVHFYVQRADSGLQVAQVVLFLLYHDAVLQDLLLDTSYLYGVASLLVGQLAYEHILLDLKIPNHNLLLLGNIHILPIVRIAGHINNRIHKLIVLTEHFELFISLVQLLLQLVFELVQLLFCLCLLFEGLQGQLEGLLGGCVAGDEFQLVSVYSQRLYFHSFSVQVHLHLLLDVLVVVCVWVHQVLLCEVGQIQALYILDSHVDCGGRGRHHSFFPLPLGNKIVRDIKVIAILISGGQQCARGYVGIP